MQNHKGFRRFICVTVLCALLMVSMGRATRVSAVGTTAAIAGTAFILTGAVYLSYVALTQGEMILPAAEDMHNWLGSIGRKVSQYPSGAEAYQDIYQGLARSPVGNVIDGVWEWTEARLKAFVNDFADTRIIDGLIAHEIQLELTEPTTNYDYSSMNFVSVPQEFYYRNTLYSFSDIISSGGTITALNGPRVIVTGDGNYAITFTDINTPVRNILTTNNYYHAQTFIDGNWVSIPSCNIGYRSYSPTLGGSKYLYPAPFLNRYSYGDSGLTTILGQSYLYPPLADAEIYVEATGETIEVIPAENTEIVHPNWNDPDNENRPIIPWVPIPDLPTGVPTPPGYTGTPKWGFPLQDLLDLLEELARSLIDIGAIGELINQFAGQHGDDYYLYYDDGDTNYYTYYQPTIFDNDTEYVTYNINISEQEDVIPVDLNTISLYTNNEYLDAVKQSARNFGDAIGEYVAFWHNTDYTLTYTILGSLVLILIGAFIGKWGHS